MCAKFYVCNVHKGGVKHVTENASLYKLDGEITIFTPSSHCGLLKYFEVTHICIIVVIIRVNTSSFLCLPTNKQQH